MLKAFAFVITAFDESTWFPTHIYDLQNSPRLNGHIVTSKFSHKNRLTVIFDVLMKTLKPLTEKTSWRLVELKFSMAQKNLRNVSVGGIKIYNSFVVPFSALDNLK